MRYPIRFLVVLALLAGAASATVTVSDGRSGIRRASRLAPPSIPYVIVTDATLQAEFRPLVQARTDGGLDAALVTLQKIDATYPTGVDLAERVRLFLRDAHATWGTRWVLLGGDESVVPMRRAFVPTGPVLGDVFMPTDQYYACLDGNWNADGDDVWGENPGDDVDFTPELYIGRAPVGDARETATFVRRTLEYETRLATGAPRSALLAAEILAGTVDLSPESEGYLRPMLETDPHRSIVRLYENSAAWPGALQESRPALLEALDGGHDLAILLGAGAPQLIAAGVEPVDHVSAQDLLGLENAPPLGPNPPQYPIVYAMSAYTTAPGEPLSIGNALFRAPNGGAVAVLATTDCQFVSEGFFFMEDFFDRAVGDLAVPIGEALAGAITAASTGFVSNGVRLTTQGMMLLGDPALRIDPVGGPVVARRAAATRVSRAKLDHQTLAIRAPETMSARTPALVVTGVRMALPSIEGPRIVRNATTMRFELPLGPTRTYSIDAFDASGRKVRSLASGAAAPGPFTLDWDLRSDAGALLPAGVYFVRLELGGASLTHRLVLLR